MYNTCIIDLNGSKGHVYIWMCAYIYVFLRFHPTCLPIHFLPTLHLHKLEAGWFCQILKQAGYTVCRAQCLRKMRSLFQNAWRLKTVATEHDIKHPSFWAWYLCNHTNHTPVKWSLISDLLRRGKTASQRECQREMSHLPPQLLHPGRLCHPNLLPTYSLNILIKNHDKLVDATKGEIDVLIQLIRAPLLAPEIKKGI